jgi:L-lactate dehydrogenase complex protein LldG
MSSRDQILATIRSNRPKLERPLPVVPLFDDRTPSSLLTPFKESLERMGGLFLEIPPSSDPRAPVNAKLGGAKVVYSTVPEFTGNRRMADIRVPQDLADVDFAIVRASFAVAETGSVLLTETDLEVNAVAYLAQHLIVLLDPADIVVNLHHAYRRPMLDLDDDLPGTEKTFCQPWSGGLDRPGHGCSLRVRPARLSLLHRMAY